MKILVATTNKGKLAELSAMLDADVEWVGLDDVDSVEEVVEDGKTFADNARKKALGYAKQTGLWTIADDSGLAVDALDGAPGVRSARFCDIESNDAKQIDRENTAKVLTLLKGVPEQRRTGRFVCHLCLASPERILAETEGTVEGVITAQPIGDNGFGYDPIFFVPSLKKTLAEVSAEQKNMVSHRGNAIRRLKPLLAKL